MLTIDDNTKAFYVDGDLKSFSLNNSIYYYNGDNNSFSTSFSDNGGNSISVSYNSDGSFKFCTDGINFLVKNDNDQIINLKDGSFANSNISMLCKDMDFSNIPFNL